MPTEAVEAYPEPRLQRSPPSPSSSYLSHVAGLSPPRSRVFNVEMGSAANTRSTVSFGVINGPAIFKRLSLQARQAVDPPLNAWEIGYSEVAVTESSVAVTTTRPFTQLCSRVTHPYAASDARLTGYIYTTSFLGIRIHELEPNLLITLPQFYFVVSTHQFLGANLASTFVTAHILENVHPDAVKYLT